MRSNYTWVRDRLHAWGHWRRKDVTGLGYPGMTPEARLRESPGRSTKPVDGPDYRPPTDEVRETDRLITALEDALTLAMWCRYVQQVEPKRGATICGVQSPESYWALVEKAERMVCIAIRKIC